MNVQEYQANMTEKQGKLFELRLKLFREDFEKSQVSLTLAFAQSLQKFSLQIVPLG